MPDLKLKKSLIILILCAFCCTPPDLWAQNGQSGTEEILIRAREAYRTGDDHQAFVLYRKAVLFFPEPFSQRALLPHSEIIAYLYTLEEKPDTAEYFYRMNLSYCQTRPNDTIGMIRGLIGLGEAINATGKHRVALGYFKLAEKMLRRVRSNYLMKADLAYRLGDISYFSGDYQMALKYFRLAESRLSLLDEGETYLTELLNTAIGQALMMQHDYTQASVYFERIIQHPQTSEKVRKVVSGQLGLCYLRLGMHAEAEDKLNWLISHWEAEDTPEISENMGRMATLLGQERRALQHLQHAFSAYKRLFGFYHPKTARCAYYLADYHVSVDQPDSAIRYLDLAIRILTGEKDRAAAWVPGTTEFLRHMIPVLEKKGDAYRLMASLDTLNQRSHLEHAVKYYHGASDWTSWASKKYLSEDSRLFVSETYRSLCQKALDCCFRLYVLTNQSRWLDEALYISEKGRATALMASWTDQQFWENTEFRRFGSYDRRINAGIWRLESILAHPGLGHQTEKALAIRQKLMDLYLLREQLRESTRQSTPGMPDAFSSFVLTVASVSDYLPENTAFLEYTFSEHHLHIIGISRDETIWVRIPSDSSLLSDIRKYSDFIRQPSISTEPEDFNRFTRLSHGLYLRLIQPVSGLISSCSGLVVAPDPEMGPLVFEALIRQLPDKEAEIADFKTLNYLLNDYSVSYSYSPTLTAQQIISPLHHDGKIMILAPHYSECTDAAVLEYAEREAVRIAEITGGKLYAGNAASREQILNNHESHCIIHLSLHSFADTSDPIHSGLILAGEGGRCDTIRVSDIYASSIPSGLTVLSSCNSGYGRSSPGEGMMSIARAFQYAGSRSILMSLWPVEDKSSADIMENFYQGIQNGERSDRALQQAKKRFLDKSGNITSHPAYWAPFVLQGHGERFITEFRRDEPVKWWWYLIIGTGVFILTVLVRRLKD